MHHVRRTKKQEAAEQLAAAIAGLSEGAQRVLSILDEQRALPLEESPVPVCFLTGVAGSGKSYTLTELLNFYTEERNSFGIVAATTGIAAINLNVGTLNSLLRYFDTESLQDRYVMGGLRADLNRLARDHENLIIDEVSMMDGRQLTIIYQAIKELNELAGMEGTGRRFGLVLTGDFCQLPPVKSPWTFEQEVWSEFEAHTVKLTKVWRQDSAKFLEALNHLRRGEGREGAEKLTGLVKWKASIQRDFDGTTIVAKNDEVERHNRLALNALPGAVIGLPGSSWGTLAKGQPKRDQGEWKNIPEVLQLKVGAYVMILANCMMDGELVYANGDCGHVERVNEGSRTVGVRLVRTGEVVSVAPVTRHHATKDEPEQGYYDPTHNTSQWDGKEPYYDPKKKRFLLGGVTYMPLRLGYASTVHKTQGLSLDRIQVDCRAFFFGNPGMAYVALSRARTPEGVVVVGTPRLFEARVKVDPKVLPWL